MKFKKLGFSTQEGLTLANFEDGWSMEYGQGGSYHCELLYKGEVVAELMEEGNGGDLRVYRKQNSVLVKEAEEAILKCLKRCDKNYMPNSPYDFCKNATKTTCDEYASLAEMLLNEYDKRKEIAKSFKKGYTCVGIYDNDYGYTTIGGVDKGSIAAYAIANNIKGIPTFYDKGYEIKAL